MEINFSYDKEFEELIINLKRNYGEEIFEIEGIGSQLDLCRFSQNFYKAKVTADASVDANANVEDMSVIAYENESGKPLKRFNSLYLIWKYLKQYYGLQVANRIIEQQISGDYYINDLSGVQQAYCFNFTAMDVCEKGLPFVTKVKSEPPKHLSSFLGQMIHFSVYASNSILGACGLADLLIVSSWYVDKLFKENPTLPPEYLWKQVKQELQSFVYSCNQPFRGGIQSGFYNVSVYDDVFLDQLCSEYFFPDGSFANKATIKKIQEIYIDLMNETLRTCAITFPVTTACFAVDGNNNILDREFVKFIADKNREFAFINIYSGKTSVLSSCCRLRSDRANEYFNQFGAGGTKIGSLGVVTINLPRIGAVADGNKQDFFKILDGMCWDAIRINATKRNIIKKRIENGNQPLYTLGFMDINKQYSTIGVNGINEAVEFMGYDILTEEGQNFVVEILNFINAINDKATTKYKAPHNMEQTPSETSAVKVAKKDNILRVQNKYKIYSNQFIPLTTNADILDRIKLQGMFDSKMSGGSICHLSVDTRIDDAKQIEDLIVSCAKQGVVYWAINYNLQQCEAGHMSVGRKDTCEVCGQPIVTNYTRVVGFITATKNWNKTRRELDYPNRQFYKI